jgi:aspartyl-tRNA(Asn)/glutamyl-tRNA(Gln) amidotransferase subunit B
MAVASNISRSVASARLKIGMEIHVELATRTKMFTRVANVAHPDHYDAEPNSLIDPMVAALPGALPVINKRAVEMSIMIGLALNCQVAPATAHSKWDRKNYFYPDLPKGYQISQYDLPLCFDGAVEIPTPLQQHKRIGIIRAHLEEDTGKLGHELPGGFHYEGSLVDLNRAGTPLLEIVTAPDLESADEAVTFGKELRNICRFVRVTEGIMQRGHMRFEPNVNVIIDTDDGHEFATPIVEIKNLNSFKSLKNAIEYELKRQVEQWQLDGIAHRPGLKSTRGWDDVRGVTVLQREKEEAHDYRYFPDPDLPPVVVSDAWREEIAARIPELPMRRRARYQDQYGLPAKDALALTDDADLCFFYEACIEAVHALSGSQVPTLHAGKECAKWLLNAGAKRANDRGVGIHELGISARQIAQIIHLRDQNTIGSTAADELFGLLCEQEYRNANALDVATARGLVQVKDEAQLDQWVDEATAAQPQAAADFAAGKDAAAGRLVGHVMRISNGQADAAAVNARLREKLRK